MSLEGRVFENEIRTGGMPIIDFNKRFKRMTGYSAEESVGHNCRFLQGEDREQPGPFKLRRAIALRQRCDVMRRNDRNDGLPFSNALLISPVVDASGVVFQSTGLWRGISDRHSSASRWLGGG